MQSDHTLEQQYTFYLTPTKISSSPLTDHSENNSPILKGINISLPHDLRMNLFEKTVEQCLISQTMNRRGINWLYSLSWSKGFSQPCIWTAVLLFYAYKNNVPFSKQQVQPLLGICLQLSSKFYESYPLESQQILMALSRPVCREKMVRYQQKVLSLIDYNLIIPHYLTSFLQTIDDDQIASKICFICELFSLNNHEIFFDKLKIERIVNLVTIGRQQNEGDMCQIRQILADKESRCLYNRYGNKFDIDSFLNEFSLSY